jgi:hypothetical protein
MRGHPIAWALVGATVIMEATELVEYLLAGEALVSDYFPASMVPYAAIKLLAFPNTFDHPVHNFLGEWLERLSWLPHIGVALIIGPFSFAMGWLLERLAVRLGSLKVLAGYFALSAATAYLINLAAPHFLV